MNCKEAIHDLSGEDEALRESWMSETSVTLENTTLRIEDNLISRKDDNNLATLIEDI